MTDSGYFSRVAAHPRSQALPRNAVLAEFATSRRRECLAFEDRDQRFCVMARPWRRIRATWIRSLPAQHTNPLRRDGLLKAGFRR